MNFKQFVYRNTMRNKPLYLAYFFSTLVSVMVFFSFTAMAFHPILQTGVSQKLIIGLLGSAIMIYLFSMFFVWYSMGIFLQSRKKEFGLLLIQGMSMKQLKRMISFETIIIGFWATIFGTLAGIGFSQLILLIARQSLQIAFASYFPTAAIGLTFLSFLILFLVSSFFVRFQLPKQSIQELLKADEQGKGTIHFSKVKSTIAVLLLAIGYGLALWAKGLIVITVFFPVLIMVVVGTLLFFSQLSVHMIEFIKRRKGVFWKKKNLIVLSDLAFRMKDNAKSFFLITIVSTVSFVAVGTLFGVQAIFLGVFGQISSDFSAPAEGEYTQLLEKEIQRNQLDYKKMTYTTFGTENKFFIHEKEFNQLAAFYGEPQVEVEPNQAVQLVQSGLSQKVSERQKVEVNKKEVQVKQLRKTSILSVPNQAFIVPNSIQEPENQENVSKETVYLLPHASKKQKIDIGQAMSMYPQITATDFIATTILTGYAPVLFVGIFVSLVFIISAGSFLYFRLYSDLGNDVKKFAMIYRMGLSRRELKRMVYRQVSILFFVPLIISFAHSLVALNAMYKIFNLTLQPEAFQVLGIFVSIQIIYYFLASRLYFKSICFRLGIAK